jgi:hypothetical protein
MQSSIRQLIVGVAFAIGMTAIVLSAIGGAVAQAPVQQVWVPDAQTEFQIRDRLQLRGYFVGGSRDRPR